MAGGWESLGLLPELVQTVEEDFDWILPSAVQDECIPLLLGGGDVMGSAETGSGKTAEQDSKKAKNESDDTSKKQLAEETVEFVMSIQDRDPSIAFHPDGNRLRIQSRDKTRWAGCRCCAGILADTMQDGNPVGLSFEVAILDKDGTVRVGWSSEDASLQLGTDKDGYGYGGTGMKVNSGKFDPFPDKNNKVQFTMGDVIGCHLEIFPSTTKNKATKNKKQETVAEISFSKNGKMVGSAFTIIRTNTKLSLYPTVCMKDAECELNFGGDTQKPLRFPLHGGYEPLATLLTSRDKKSNMIVANNRDALSSRLEQQKNSERKGPLAIVIEPTRDLAEQSYRAFQALGKRLTDTPVQMALLVGGIKPTDTLKLLDRNQVDVLVGTPPIISSYMKKGTIKASRCRFFVLDEADELISRDSLNHIRAIYGRLLASTDVKQDRFDRLQVCFFSATLHSKEVRSLAETLCHKPLWVDLRSPKNSMLPDTVHHVVVEVSPSASFELLSNDDDLIETDAVHRDGELSAKIEFGKLNNKERNSECIKQVKPKVVLDVMEKFAMEQVLIFCRTNLDCDLMEKFLRKSGSAGGMGIAEKYSCGVLAGMRSMDERRKNLQDFKDGEVRCLICTDVAARGIDIQQLPFVINCTLPDKPEIYVHRVGRVGRAERMGLAISLVSTVKERVWFCKEGNKPPCPDTRDFDKGGNCIWYDEPKYMNDIEKLLKQNNVSVTKLQWPDLKLPSEIQNVVNTGGYGERAQTDSAVDPAVKAKIETIRARVKQLELVESNLQDSYWKLRNKFRSVKSK